MMTMTMIMNDATKRFVGHALPGLSRWAYMVLAVTGGPIAFGTVGTGRGATA